MKMKTTAYSETELVERAASDLDAFGELVERYRGTIQRQCYSSVRDRDHAEDLAQETFIRAYLNLDQLKDPSRFPNWLRKIASNACREFARSSARHELPSDTLLELVASSDAPSDTSTPGLDALPPETRACVDLFYTGGLSYAEIARALEITVASVKARLHRAKAVLREEMSDMAPRETSAFTESVIGKLEQLRSRSPEDRARAARDIRSALADDEVEKIVHGLMTDPDVWGRRDIYNREEALSCCRRYRSPRIREALAHLLLNSPMEELRLKSAGLLAAQRDPAAIPSLRQAIADPKNPKEVVGAAKSTIHFLEGLDTHADSHRDQLRFRAEVEQAATDRKSRVELLRRLKTALQDPDSSVRNQAIKALVELGDKRAVPALAKLLDDPVPGIRQAAAVALGDLKSPAALPVLLAALDNRTGQDLQTVLIALYKIADHRALPALLEFLERTCNGNLIVTTATNPIVEMITADDLAQLRKVIATIRAVPARGYRPFHLDWLWIASLAKAADERYIPDIAEQLRDSQCLAALPASFVPHLLEALGRIGGAESIAVLKQYLHSGWARPAAWGLVMLGEPGREVLREALYSDNAEVRFAVCFRFMFSGGDPASAERLKHLADTATDSRTKMYAKGAWLKSIGWRSRPNKHETGPSG